MTKYLQKPAVQMGLLVVVVGIAAGAFMLARQPAQIAQPGASNEPGPAKGGGGMGVMAVEQSKVERGENVEKQTSGTANAQRLELPKRRAPPPSLVSTSTPQNNQPPPPPPLPKLVHIVNTAPEPYVPQEPELFAPRGLLIKAALVITVDSSSLETPVLALVTEDVYWNGKLIVPAGTQVQAKAAQGRTRDRIEVKGNYIFVWADGREYNINCVALDHERLSDGTYGITDGSAGIRGQVIKNDQYAEIKIMLAEALQGIMNNQQSQFQTIYGLQPQNTNRNAALGGGSQAASAYSSLLTSKLEKDLDFVRVSAGTQFYIYTMDVFEPGLASIAGLRQNSQPTPSWKIAEETYSRARAAEDSSAKKAAETAAEAEKERARQQSAEQAMRIRTLVNPPGSTPGASPAASGAAATPVTHSNPKP